MMKPYKQISEDEIDEIRIFHHPEFGDLRVMIVDGEIAFNLEEVAEKLGYENLEEVIKIMEEIENDE